MRPILFQRLLHFYLSASLQDHPYFYLTIADLLILSCKSLAVNMSQRGHRKIAFIVKIFSTSTRVIVDTLILVFLISDTYTNPWRVCCYRIMYGPRMFRHLSRVFYKVRKMLKSRSVIKKIHSDHPTATCEELATFADLCAICMKEMEEDTVNKKLPCRHIFHGDCLLPWLLIRRVCPTCARGCWIEFDKFVALWWFRVFLVVEVASYIYYAVWFWPAKIVKY